MSLKGLLSGSVTMELICPTEKESNCTSTFDFQNRASPPPKPLRSTLTHPPILVRNGIYSNCRTCRRVSIRKTTLGSSEQSIRLNAQNVRGFPSSQTFQLNIFMARGGAVN